MINPDKKIITSTYKQGGEIKQLKEPATQEMRDMVETIKTATEQEQAEFLKQKALSDQAKAKLTESGKKKGKLLIQIDGLSYRALKEALDKGVTPNIKAMIEKENYTLQSYLCGLPAVTIPIQAQMFYGVPLPGNQWYSKETKSKVASTSREPQVKEAALKNKEEGIMTGGSTFSSPLLGGEPKDTALTIAGLRKAKGKEVRNALKLFWEGKKEEGHRLLNLAKTFYKTAANATKRIKDRGNYRTFLDKTIGLLMGASCTIFDPIIAQGIKKSMEKGSPVIYADMDLYDNYAHYLEANDKDAFKALKATDAFIGELKKEAGQSKERDYNVILFSDHGQTRSENFIKEFGKPVKDVILEYANEITKDPKANEADIAFIDVYSLGNLYFNSMPGTANLSDVQNKYPSLIEKIVSHPGIDMVVAREGEQIIVYGKDVEGKTGKVTIGDKIEIEGANPLAKYNDVGDINLVAKQLKDYSKIPETGDLMVFGGWKQKGEVYDFCEKYTFDSLHGGLGSAQSRPFILSNPEDPIDTSKITRAADLHEQLRQIVNETK